MPYDRFQMIGKYLHLVNNEEVDLHIHPNAKMHKNCPIFLNANFFSLYIPARVVTVDEILMPYNGRLYPMHASKRSRFVIKVFMLCDSKTGYI